MINYQPNTDPSVSRAKAWLRLATDVDYPLYLPVANKSYYNTTTSALNNQSDDLEINLYPNPTNNLVYLAGTYQDEDEVKFDIFDLTGRKVLTRTFGGNTGIVTFDLSDFANGTYIYRVDVNGVNIVANRLVITK